uniref:Disintegrin and metalloproteinase domain-containing protein 19-like n=1 Tax=Pundamilia nyererei TaxID=303518 RepID=A0A3B4GHM0_9CICH
KRNTLGTTKYIELYIVADNTLKNNICCVYVQFYRALNIRVPLIGLEVWTERDQCIITEEPNATLWSFLQWRQKLKSRKKHDNAQLLTGVTFKGTTIGMAPLEGMCSLENSGGINVDHSELSIGAAATMAHEIGHNFGMSHDHDSCCVEATADQGGCVMAAATGKRRIKISFFSYCSKRDLDRYFQKGGGMCLYNIPNMNNLVGGKKCGNGFVEDGEECDCGEPDASVCIILLSITKLKMLHVLCSFPPSSPSVPYACQLKQAGTMCRRPAGACDLPEYCTGASPYCPANVYLLDGSSCQYGMSYVLVSLFSDAKCGKIQCHSAATKPKEVKCRGTYVYSTQDGQGDLPDPGLVMTGTKCGEGKVGSDQAGILWSGKY